ncbi:MAG: lactate permease LctP family transporter [Terracidiphilus sp.]|jgi:lactate permease
MTRIVSWDQVYFLFGHGLGFSVLLAALPIFTLLFLLGVLRKPAWIAGLAGLAVTIVLAVGIYRMPPVTAISAAANGAAFGLFPISWIVFWAIALFRVTVETGQFEIIRDSIGKLTSDSRLQALLIAFAFGAFLEGAAGFGTPVAIAATMLIGLGFSPFSASAICLLANTAPVAFGSIGIPIFTLAGTTGLPLEKLSAAVGLILTPMCFFIPAYLIVAIGGFDSLSGILLPTLLAGSTFAVVQFLVSTYLGPQLTDILAALAAMAALVLYIRFLHPTNTGKEAVAPGNRFARMAARGEIGSGPERRVIPDHGVAAVLHAWMPYGILVICVLLWGWAPVHAALNRFTLLLPWPFLHDVVHRMPPIVSSPAPYPAIFNLNWLSASGTACMIATLLSALCMKMKPRNFAHLLAVVMRQLRLPTVTVASVLAIAFLMNYCGATATLGLAFSATGAMFPFFSALLGWVGVFLTGSDTSANALFGSLQVVTANRLGFDPVLMAAANSSGGVMGKMISLQTIAIAAAATGLSQPDEAKLFRFTLKHSILLASIVGCVALLLAYAFHFRWE